VNVAIDFEAFYSKDITVVDQGAWHYARATDIYMVSMYSDYGVIYVGSPDKAPWLDVGGMNWIMHNAAFDMTLFEALKEQRFVPKIGPQYVYDTADLSSYLGYPRSLAEASKYLLGSEMSKSTRDNMKGKRWKDMTPEFRKEVADYALGDAKNTLEIFKKHGHLMPEHEWEISRMTREMGMRGVPVEIDKLNSAKQALLAEVEKTKALLPWVGKSHLPPLSLQAIRDQCAEEGIWAPDSFAEKETQAQKWEEEFGDKYPWVNGVRAFRKANKHLKAVETMISRTRPSGRMGYELKYFGATTGRDSGGGGWNAQNLPKGEIAGVELRKLIVAPEGKTLVVADLAQIESRVISFLARDDASLNIMRSGVDVYEAHARATMGYTDPRPLKEVDNKLRQLAKARCLAGTTPILTEKGYLSIAELKDSPCVRVWDGITWVGYASIIESGKKEVRNFGGEHFTEDHHVFLEDGSAQPIGALYQGTSLRKSCPTLLRRNTPSGEWADVWALACFVARSLAKEWATTLKSALHRMWNGV
jgi:DNA polymerase I-like protein with 3'-5' exonuclease and polymerase domains